MVEEKFINLNFRSNIWSNGVVSHMLRMNGLTLMTACVMKISQNLNLKI